MRIIKVYSLFGKNKYIFNVKPFAGLYAQKWYNDVCMRKYKPNVYKSLTLITQFSINMLVPIFLCTFLGIFLDRRLGTSYIVIVLFFLGAAGGFRNIYIMAKDIYDDKGKNKKI